MDLRYARNLGTLGKEGQKKLACTHVAIAGAGGLGGTVFEIMVRAGVGKITIIDFDVFEPTNLNRQLLATEKTLGQNKAVAAAERASEVNSEVEAVARQERLTDANAEKLLAGTDLILDCLGNIRDRFALERAARKLEIPMVHAAVAGMRGQIMVVRPEGPGLEAIYGSESQAPASGEETTFGTPPASAMAIAALQANEAIKLLTGRSELMKDNISRIDLNNFSISRFTI